MKNVRFYPPFENEGSYHDFLDELHKAGATVADDSRHATWNGASYVFAHDEDQFRIQLLSAPDETSAWSQIERVHEPWMSHVQGEETAIGAEDTRTYGPYSQAQANAMLSKIKSQGMTVTGNNPWHVDTNTHGVKFDATYDGSNITIKITGANFYVSNAKVWDKLDPMMQAAKNISGDGTLPATKAAADATPTAKAPKATSASEREGSGISMGVILIAVVAAVVLFGKK